MPERVVVASGSGIFTSRIDKTTDAGAAFSQGKTLIETPARAE
jgi:hypothetical protein